MNNDDIPNPFDEDAPIDSTPTFSNTSLNPVYDDNSGRSLVWLVLGVAAIGCRILFAATFFFFQPDAKSLVGQYFPSPTATITPTPTPNLTATASMLQSTVVSAQDQWAVNLKETFDNNDSHWYVGTDDNQYDKVPYAVKDGKYHWETAAHKCFIQWIRLSEKFYTDFYISAETHEINNTPIGDSGIIFREDKNGNHYYFAVKPSGSFFVSIYYNEKWTDLISSNYSEFIQQKEPNQLTVWAKGSHFIFFINGHYVGETTDDQISTGKIGIAVGLYDASTQSTFEFDNIELRSPAPPATATPTLNLTATQQVLLNSNSTAQAIQSTATSIASTWRIILADSFDSNKKGWGTIASEDARAKTIIKIANGKYVWDIATHDLNITWEKASQKSLVNFALSVDVKQISGPDTAESGVTFREDPYFNYYSFGINNKGEYFLQRYYSGWVTLIDYTKSDLIHPGEVNRITVIAEGSHFTFLINSQYLTEFTDDRIKAGQAGLTTNLHDANQHAVFEFDNFELRAP